MTEATYDVKYAIVSPVKDEEKYIEETLRQLPGNLFFLKYG